MSRDVLLVLSTAPDEGAARALATALVEEDLAACVNLVPGVTSVYRWEGRVVQEGEFLLVAKTSRARLADLTARLVALHPYQVPEVVALPVDGGHGPYLDWVLDSVGRAP